MPNNDRTIDLHAHTTASDGEYSPSELVARANALGLTAIAVTDHDTTAGIPEALASGAVLGIEVVPGIELSAAVDRGQCHLLGFMIDPADPTLLGRLQYVVDMRNSRNDRIVNRLKNECGFDIPLSEVEAIAGGDIVARPHFARAMLNRGCVNSMQEAFDIYLGKGGRAYVERVRLSPEEAISLVHGAGGAVFLAHPNNLKRYESGTAAEIKRLVAMGLDGIEARYNRHTPQETERYLALAESLGILTCGGSDFHGPSVKPDVFLGHVEGEQPAPAYLLDDIKSLIKTRRT